MFNKQLNCITELLLWGLIFSITLANAPIEVFSYLIVFIFILKVFFRFFILKERKLNFSLINILLWVFIIIVFISSLRSEYLKESSRGFSRLPKYIFLYFALVDFFADDKKRILRFFWVIIAVSGITFLNGIFQGIFGFDVFMHKMLDKLDYLSRISASFVHPNDFAAFIISVLPLTLVFLCKKLSLKPKIILAVVLCLGMYCLLKTSSRGAWIGFFISIIFFFIFYNKKLAIILPLAIIALVMILPNYGARVKNLFKNEHNTVWERGKLWEGTWNMIKEHPVAGFGINTFSKYFPKYKPQDYPDLRYAHNSYLQIWAEIGMLGLLAFLAVIFSIFRGAFFNITKKNILSLEGLMLLGFISGYIGFLIQSSFDNNLFSLPLTSIFWVLSATVISLNKYVEVNNV